MTNDINERLLRVLLLQMDAEAHQVLSMLADLKANLEGALMLLEDEPDSEEHKASLMEVAGHIYQYYDRFMNDAPSEVGSAG